MDVRTKLIFKSNQGINQVVFRLCNNVALKSILWEIVAECLDRAVISFKNVFEQTVDRLILDGYITGS